MSFPRALFVFPALLLVLAAAPLSAQVTTGQVTAGQVTAGQVTTGQVTTRLVTGGLDRPVRLVAPPGDARLFVVEQSGRIRVFDRDGTDRGVFVDLSRSVTADGERGLLGLAFAPDYATSGRFYVDHTGLDGDTRLIRYLASTDPDRADPSSAVTLLTIDQPYSNHNGGHLEFGPDGMLYFGLGDGGSSGDPGNRAQDGQSLLGKLLRLDVSGAGYAPAAGNPFIGSPPRDEIWSLGLRNPWCFSFDRLNGDLYIADVGQNLIEEIDITGGGGGLNYGWRLMEGSSCYSPATGCNDGTLILPAHEYTHGGTPFRCSVSGGYVYRGDAIPELQGTYFFADYCSVQIWGLRWTAAGGVSGLTDWTAALTPTGGYDAISAFGQDSDGELYILDHGGGQVYRLEPSTSGTGPPPAARPRLGQNTPNPFNPSTQLPYSIPVDGEVTLTIHDVSGRHLRTLVREQVAAGEHTVTWDGRAADARDLPGGVYIARLSTTGGQSVRKMVLAK